ncbi:MAG: hypothetical protein PHE78_08545 [Candidatus Gastranaerophilales bacterium]|nr:hypothetical protein [Candidatus Gastranaerophilales bacterium]
MEVSAKAAISAVNSSSVLLVIVIPNFVAAACKFESVGVKSAGVTAFL